MVTSLSTPVAEDALAILVGLGMKQREAQTVLAQVLSTGATFPDAQALVRAVYKSVKRYQGERASQVGIEWAAPAPTFTIPRYMQILHTTLLMVVLVVLFLWGMLAAVLLVPTFLYPVMSWGPGRFWWNLGGVVLTNGWFSVPLLATVAVGCTRPLFRRLVVHYAYICMAFLLLGTLCLMLAILGLMLLASLLGVI